MSTESNTVLSVADLSVEVVKKDIKNLHIGVYPPDGRVRVAAPCQMSDDAIRIAVIARLTWIHRQVREFQSKTRQTSREMVSGESHYFLGQRYRLDVVKQEGERTVAVKGKKILALYTRPDDGTPQRMKTLLQWYREQLHQIVAPLMDKWQQQLDIVPPEWTFKRMKTKWGTCNPGDRRIWLNLELAKVTPQLIEYVVVHELVHLNHADHDKTFERAMDKALPNWRSLRAELNNTVLGHQDWERDSPE